MCLSIFLRVYPAIFRIYHRIYLIYMVHLIYLIYLVCLFLPRLSYLSNLSYLYYLPSLTRLTLYYHLFSCILLSYPIYPMLAYITVSYPASAYLIQCVYHIGLSISESYIYIYMCMHLPIYRSIYLSIICLSTYSWVG